MKKIGIVLRNEEKYKVISNEIINYLNPFDIILIGIVLTDDMDFNKVIEIINICDGVILPGGDNYSDIDLKLCRYLNEKDIPTFGICLGMQCMAEAFNGIVELLDTDNHYSKNEYVHRVTIKDNSFIYKILNCNSMYVNSRHKYCIVNTNLDISSYSDDFVIEGVEDKNKKFYVGVQWHPESMKNDINSRLLIEEFINKC